MENNNTGAAIATPTRTYSKEEFARLLHSARCVDKLGFSFDDYRVKHYTLQIIEIVAITDGGQQLQGKEPLVTVKGTSEDAVYSQAAEWLIKNRGASSTGKKSADEQRDEKIADLERQLAENNAMMAQLVASSRPAPAAPLDAGGSLASTVVSDPVTPTANGQTTTGQAAGGTQDPAPFDPDKAGFEELKAKAKELGLPPANVAKTVLVASIKAKLAENAGAAKTAQ